MESGDGKDVVLHKGRDQVPDAKESGRYIQYAVCSQRSEMIAASCDAPPDDPRNSRMMGLPASLSFVLGHAPE